MVHWHRIDTLSPTIQSHPPVRSACIAVLPNFIWFYGGVLNVGKISSYSILSSKQTKEWDFHTSYFPLSDHLCVVRETFHHKDQQPIELRTTVGMGGFDSDLHSFAFFIPFYTLPDNRKLSISGGPIFIEFEHLQHEVPIHHMHSTWVSARRSVADGSWLLDRGISSQCLGVYSLCVEHQRQGAKEVASF